ncbi:hypothetical protein Vretimale_9977, partial [Volvox reticuliferus]
LLTHPYCSYDVLLYVLNLRLRLCPAVPYVVLIFRLGEGRLLDAVKLVICVWQRFGILVLEMGSPVEEGSRIVKQVIDSGAFDDIRKNVFEELRQSTALRDYVREQVDSSKTLSGDASKSCKDRKKVLEDLQNELKDRLVERASRVVWEILTNADGRVALDIERKVHEAICYLHEAREKQQQQQAAAAPPPQVQITAADAGQGSSLPMRLPTPSTASLAGQPQQQQQQQPSNRPPPRHYGVYGNF